VQILGRATGVLRQPQRRLALTRARKRHAAARWPEVGTHFLTLLVDTDHYECVTMARDKATRDIVVGCDLFGLAAETSVLVPLERAAQLGLRADAFFQRPSRTLRSGGWAPDPPAIGLRGVKLSQN
jgi:hypothetical protein